jgi:hypothetical protein
MTKPNITSLEAKKHAHQPYSTWLDDEGGIKCLFTPNDTHILGIVVTLGENSQKEKKPLISFISADKDFLKLLQTGYAHDPWTKH